MYLMELRLFLFFEEKKKFDVINGLIKLFKLLNDWEKFNCNEVVFGFFKIII